MIIHSNCSCREVTCMTERQIDFCPLHAAASDLAVALREALGRLRSLDKRLLRTCTPTNEWGELGEITRGNAALTAAGLPKA